LAAFALTMAKGYHRLVVEGLATSEARCRKSAGRRGKLGRRRATTGG